MGTPTIFHQIDFFTPSMRRVDNREKEKRKWEKISENSGPLTSLPVNRLNSDRLQRRHLFQLPMFNSRKLSSHQNGVELCQQFNSSIRTSLSASYNHVWHFLRSSVNESILPKTLLIGWERDILKGWLSLKANEPARMSHFQPNESFNTHKLTEWHRINILSGPALRAALARKVNL